MDTLPCFTVTFMIFREFPVDSVDHGLALPFLNIVLIVGLVAAASVSKRAIMCPSHLPLKNFPLDKFSAVE